VFTGDSHIFALVGCVRKFVSPFILVETFDLIFVVAWQTRELNETLRTFVFTLTT
jgi:hypothetical protein